MQLTRSAARVILVLILTATVKVSTTRPEITLEKIFTTPFVPRSNASFECIRDGEIYLKALSNYTPWALQMYDASVKIPSGLITGNHRALGNFDECLRVNSNEHGFIGQACNVGVQFNISADNGTFHELDLGDLFRNIALASGLVNWNEGVTIIYEWIWCVPSTCNSSEVQRATEIMFQPLIIPGRVNMTVNVHQKCHTQETDKATWDTIDYYYTFGLAAIALIIVASTGYDIYTMSERCMRLQSKSQDNRARQWKTVFTAFSLYKNVKELFCTNRPQDYIGCLDSLRVFSICWIIYGHTHYMQATSIKLNLADIPWMHHDLTNMLVLNANLATDTFFLLSGVVLAYTELLKKKGVPNWYFSVSHLWIRRYVRLTPAYAIMIGFYTTLFYKFGTGPHWDSTVGINRDYCRENWWLNLIYFNNYFNLDRMCMSQTWYLSVDMQLVWLSPLVLYPMLKFKRFYFIIIFIMFLLLSILVPFFVTYIFELPGTMLYYKEQIDLAQVYTQIYSKVYCRFGTYVIGLGLGYVLYKTRSSSLKMGRLTVICAWVFAITIGLAALLGPRNFYFDNHNYNKLEASFYAGLHRQVFAISISWIIFYCKHNYAGFLNCILSWPGWVPFSKLTYCAYLSHYLFLIADVGTVRAADNLTRMNVLRTSFANMMLTLMISVVWHLCFENPFLILERLIFSRKPKLPQNDQKGTITDKETCKSTNEPSTTRSGQDNPAIVTEIVNEKHEGAANKNKIEQGSCDIIKANGDAPAKHTNSDDVEKSGYINPNFYRSFNEDEQFVTVNTTETASGSTDTEATLNANSNETLK